MSEAAMKRGIMEQGYGLLSKKVMRDRNLSCEAKAIYGYLCSFAGAGSTAYPSVKLMTNELKMTEKRFFKHRQQLLDRNYIQIHKHRNGNRLENNVYEVVFNPDATPSHFESVQTESVQNDLTIINKSINNNLTINVNNIVNKEEVTTICDSFYTDFSIGRWTKKQWNTMIEAFVNELMSDNRLQDISNLEAYVYASIKQMAHRHDIKTGKKDISFSYEDFPLLDK